MREDTLSKIIDYLKGMKEEHKQYMFIAERDCEDIQESYELGCVETLTDVIKYLKNLKEF